MEEKRTCSSCKHFIRHYIRLNRKFSPIGWGHCMHPMVKQRKEETPACERYVEAKRVAGAP